MKRAFAAVAVASCAGLAVAGPIDFHNTPIFSHGNGVTITELSADTPANSTSAEDIGIVYDSLAFEGNVQTPMSTTSISDDYVSTISSPSTLSVFRFVGGVESVNEVVFFQFRDTGGVPVSSFGVRLPSASFTSIWTITLTDPNATAVPAAGFVDMIADDGTNNPDGLPTLFAWRFKDVAPAVGSTTGDVHRMTMEVVPAPASMALLGLGGLAAARRRR
ncbi:MAG: PEP-CTERM sorting domain-containing protein [Phycisphaerales bacterium JB037]